MASSNIRIRRRHDGVGIQGKVPFAAVEGLLVNLDSSDLTTPSLKKATAIAGFALERAVVTQAELESILQTDQLFPNRSSVKNPSIIGDNVSASKILEAELEGPDFVLTSGTGLINASTAINTALSTNQGRVSAAQGGEEVVGYLRGKLTVQDSDNLVRALVQFV